MKRLASLLLAAAALALIAAGCGSKSSGSGLDTALSYVPKNAPLVIAIDTDPDGDQWQQVDKLLGKFPFAGQFKQSIKDAIKRRSNITYDDDIKPLLGNDAVVAADYGAGIVASRTYLVAWKVGDEDKGEKLVKQDARKVGNAEGADIYRSSDGSSFRLIKDGTILVGSTATDLEAALKRAGSGDHLTEDEFNSALGDLNKDALVRYTGNLQALLTGSKAANARKSKWVAALQSFAATVSADPDGIGIAYRVKTDAGSLGPQDLPLAAGAQSPPIVRRAGEIGFGLRNPVQSVRFGEAVSRVSDPTGFVKYQRNKTRLGRQLGINIDRDVIGQLTGSVTLSVGLTGSVALRADLRDPAAATATLKRAAPRIRKASKGKVLRIVGPKGGQGIYVVVQRNGKRPAFGVVGKSFVLATDAARAAQFAGQSASTVPDAKGAFVLASDARSLANAIAQRSGRGGAAQLFTAALGDLVGSVQSETSGLTANFKLKIK